MSSQRTKADREERILAAVRDSVILHGVRRTTANDIAERAGLSRMTFYRAMGSVDNAVLRALTREFQLEAERLRSNQSEGAGRDRLVGFAVEAVRTFAASPLIRAIAERDPEVLIPYVADRFGRSQVFVLAIVESLVAEGTADGSISARDASALTIFVAMQGVALSSRVLVARGELDACLEELRRMLNAYLTPASKEK